MEITRPEIIRKGREAGILSLNFNFYHGFTSEIIKKIQIGTYDIGLCSKQEENGVSFVPIKKQYFTLLINKELYESEDNLQIKWFNLPLVTYRKSSPIGKNVHELILQYNKTPNIIEELDDETSIGGFVSVNPSLAIVANTTLLKQFDLIKIPLDNEEIYHTVYLAYLTKNKDQPKIEKFRDLVEKFGDFQVRNT